MSMYDFTTVLDRKNTWSLKWERMARREAGLPDGIVPFSLADMEFPNPPEIIEGLRDYLAGTVLGYLSRPESYDAAVGSWMSRRHAWEIEGDWIVESPGVIPGFSNAIRAFSSPGDGVIVMPPVYYPFYRAIEENQRRVVRSELVITKPGEAGLPGKARPQGEARQGSHDQSRYGIDFADLEEKARDPRNRLLLFCSPHNPVGRVWEPAELEEVVRICLENDVLIISDEIHFDLVMPGHSHTVLAAVSPEAADNCMICTAPSKTFNLAGLQTANMIIKNPRLRERLVREFTAGGLKAVNMLGYKACEIAYNHCEAWLDELLVVLDKNRRLAEEFMAAEVPEIRVFPLEGTYLQWWDCRGLGAESQGPEEFLVRRARLFPDDGALFGEPGRGFVRINLACPRQVLEAALARLAEAAKTIR